METSRQAQVMTDAKAFANALVANQGTVKMDNGTVEIWDRPKSTLITFKGLNAAGAVAQAVNAHALNVDALNGSDGFVPTYNDGFAGRLINRHIVASNHGRGLKLKAITFIATNAAGSQDANVLQALDFAFVGYTVKGGVIKPEPIDLGSAIRNTQQQSGTLTLEFPEGVWINCATQLKAFITSGATVTANLLWA